MNRSTIVGLLLAGCTANPSRLEEISQEQAIVQEMSVEVSEPERAAMPPAPPLTATLANVATPAPDGIDAALWRDIGWFPADVVEISSGVGRDNTPLARWAEDSIVREFPACGPLVAAIDRIYTVKQGESQQVANVVFGSMTREQERGCLQALLPGLGMTGVQHEEATVLAREQAMVARAGWWKHGDGAVVVIEGDVPLERWSGGSLNPELLSLLAVIDPSLGMWMASTHDYGSFFTEVASSGLTLATALPAVGGEPVLLLRIGLRFASAREAEQAERGAAKFAASAPSSDGSGLTFSFRADGSWLRVEIRADLSEANAQKFMAWSEEMLANMRARAER
ncbi:hypothetical protein [Nannocystis radixulma]|uniref:Lipoprotein n=1 Tax=Nannocystis radixulma TaxID=2995305 RepID=A0ABT5BAP1_9BACT|nr:hypothetical protein [Nannocystis radixulma]MDC0670102.1 hypothetical protein [Nannocystis radixulma]